ncbi:MAG: methyltransferase domain-containing protein [Rubrobacter sp.]|nr:methyltransferase domain-containing protein [Rubrobacter sp.]
MSEHPQRAWSTGSGSPNIWSYDRISGLYDATIEHLSRQVRREAVGELGPGAGDRLLLVGVGSGLDLPYLPRGTRGLGVDLSAGMLAAGERRLAALDLPGFELRQMDARSLDLPDGSFDAVYLPLIVTVVRDGERVMEEAARVAKPGARLVVADRFWPEGRERPLLARRASALLGRFAMHFDRRFSEMHAGAPHLELLGHRHTSPRGFFDLVTLRKPG